MVEDLSRLAKGLDDKINPLVDAIISSDPLSEDYKKLLENFDATIMVATNLNRILGALAASKPQEDKKEEEK